MQSEIVTIIYNKMDGFNDHQTSLNGVLQKQIELKSTNWIIKNAQTWKIGIR